ncbi:hypothetical protein SKAU_G00346110 [Synaphobranchus kaupii]|uniref:Uncharacterized protein n=1 Tax=Synaphobranchus kaupii TaxID=118154 RepID=A0A9Q1EJP6_SYNKA|nr:hypothetical protein SKAU_G00346110 [Synaphobranchus kaupii]
MKGSSAPTPTAATTTSSHSPALYSNGNGKLTQNGEDAEQDGDEGVYADARLDVGGGAALLGHARAAAAHSDGDGGGAASGGLPGVLRHHLQQNSPIC